MIVRILLLLITIMSYHAHRDGRWLFKQIPEDLALEASDEIWRYRHYTGCHRDYWVPDKEGYYKRQHLQTPCGVGFREKFDSYEIHDPWRKSMDKKIRVLVDSLDDPLPHRPVVLYTERRVREIYKSIRSMVEAIARHTKHEIRTMDPWPGKGSFPPLPQKRRFKNFDHSLEVKRRPKIHWRTP